jgi:acetate kinase
MTRHVVTLNAGSSSIKFALFEAIGGTLSPVAVGLVEMQGQQRRISIHDGAGTSINEATWSRQDGSPFHKDALDRILAWRPVLITDEVLEYVKTLIPLAPLHQPHNIEGILAAREAWPHVLQVACFDTAFHRHHPFVNDVFALPMRYYEEGVRRYGFHGISYEYVTGRLKEIAPHHAAGRVVIAHLGNGASMCAVRDGQSVASSMGFTALDGLPMGTRCGQLDPGVVLYLMQEKKMSADEIQDLLYKESGLKGMSGISNDMRELEASDSQDAHQAIEYFIFRIRRELGGLAAVLKGIDAFVFCGGIGEHSYHVRQRVLEGMEWIGVELDRLANRNSAQVISTERSRVRVFVIPTDEEAMIARHTLAVLDRAGGVQTAG